MRIHANIEVEHDKHQRLQPISENKRARAKFERLAWPIWDQEHMLGVAVLWEGGREKVRLLGARWHAGGRAAALNVEQHHRDLGEIGEAEELLHQRNARTGGGSEGARAVPASADRNADRGDLILGLDEGVILFLCRRIDAIARAIALERFGQRG